MGVCICGVHRTFKLTLPEKVLSVVFVNNLHSAGTNRGVKSKLHQVFLNRESDRLFWVFIFRYARQWAVQRELWPLIDESNMNE